jgi:ankyrin repeat protein
MQSGPPTKALPPIPRRQRPLTPASVNSRDSGYSTDPFRSSWSTTGTAGTSPLRGSSRAQDHQSTTLNSTRVNTPSTLIIQDFPPQSRRAHSIDFDTDIANQDSSKIHNRGQNWPKRNASLNSGRASSSLDASNTTFVESQHYNNVRSHVDVYGGSLGVPSNAHDNASSHPPLSRCRLADNQFFVPTLELGPCQGCEASKAHYVASAAKFLTKEALIDQVENVRAHLHEFDIFGNTPLHFLASSGPTSRQHIKIFIGNKLDIYRTNCDNANFLHVLDPSNLGNELPLLLQETFIQAPTLLRARTYHGQTVLHSLLSRNISVDMLIAILPIFQSARNNIYARDNQGLTAMEVFCNNWLSAEDSHQRSQEDWDTLQGVIDVHVPNLKLLLHNERHATPVTLPSSSSRSDIGKLLAGQSPNGRFSGDLSSAAQNLRYQEMRSIMTESVSNPSAYDYRGRNGLHCFAHTIRLLPDPNMSCEIHRQDLLDLLTSGVDPTDFDRLGSTPLHSILSTCYNSDDEKLRAFLINVMLRRASGAPDVHMRDRRGEIPLHLACRAGLVACVEVLLCHKSDLDVLNYAGRSVIFEAKQAKVLKERTYPEEAERIQLCIGLVEKAGGFEFPSPREDLVYNNNARKL